MDGTVALLVPSELFKTDLQLIRDHDRNQVIFSLCQSILLSTMSDFFYFAISYSHKEVVARVNTKTPWFPKTTVLDIAEEVSDLVQNMDTFVSRIRYQNMAIAVCSNTNERKGAHDVNGKTDVPKSETSIPFDHHNCSVSIISHADI